jgi:outer membrane receptor protein involved in Fe transport
MYRPTLNELFRPFRAGLDATAANPLLKPERLTGAESGLDYRRDGVTLSLTAFANRLQDSIANVTLGQGPGTFPGVGFVAAGGDYRQRQNINSVRVNGLEASGQAKRGQWTVRAAAGLADAKVAADGPALPLDGLRPAQTPRFNAGLGTTWEHDGRLASLSLRHVGNQSEDDLNQRRLPPATTLDAFAAWPLGKHLQILFRGETLLDELVAAGLGGDGSVERATPRTLWLGLRFQPKR